MGDDIEHNCYVCVAHNLHDAYAMANSLSHRGKDSTGLIAIGSKGIDVLKWKGPVTMFGNKALQKIFPQQKYHTFAFHGRYKTRGSIEINLEEAHPHTLGGVLDDRGEHQFIYDCDFAMIHNGQVLPGDLNGIDLSQIKTKCDTEALINYYKDFGGRALLKNVGASYTLVVAEKNSNSIKIIRDRFEVKPGAIGEKDGLEIMASEAVAFSDMGATFSYDLSGGTIYSYSSEGRIIDHEKVISPVPKHCFFEWNYIASPKSTIDGLGVLSVRRALGERLARELKIDADFVSYIPESPKDAAEAFSQKVGLPFVETFYKIKAERSFQGSTQKERESSIGKNLFLLPEIANGGFLRQKKGIWIDDSFVRGTVGKRARLLLEDAGVKEIHLASYTPPIGIIGEDGVARGCNQGGVDMPSEEHENHRFLARNKSLEQISEEIGCSIHFISHEGMLKVFKEKGISPSKLCTFCIGGKNCFV